VSAQIITLPPRGHYLADEAGQLAGVSGATIGAWAHYGYIRASQSEPGEYPRVYSFQDVAEAIIVHELLEDKVPLRVLRPVIEQLRTESGGWPLQRAELETVTEADIPVASLLVKDGDMRRELGPHGWQLVERATVNPRRVATDLHRGGWAARQVPGLRHISVDPDTLSGRPAIKGRRVPVSLVAELADTLDGLEILHEDYDLSDEEIDDAVRWWRAASGYERLAA
jgi:uncharacterized protein (DUF433 family)/DNA-binding transcriptional MerR regulator